MISAFTIKSVNEKRHGKISHGFARIHTDILNV